LIKTVTEDNFIMQQNTTIKTVHCTGVYSKRSDSHSEHSHTIKTHRLNVTTEKYRLSMQLNIILQMLTLLISKQTHDSTCIVWIMWLSLYKVKCCYCQSFTSAVKFSQRPSKVWMSKKQFNYIQHHDDRRHRGTRKIKDTGWWRQQHQLFFKTKRMRYQMTTRWHDCLLTLRQYLHKFEHNDRSKTKSPFTPNLSVYHGHSQWHISSLKSLSIQVLNHFKLWNKWR